MHDPWKIKDAGLSENNQQREAEMKKCERC